MPSELQRVARGLVECLDQIPHLVALLQRTAQDLRQQAAYIGQGAHDRPGARTAALQLDHAARACEEAAFYAAQAPPKAHAWAMAMVGGTSPHTVPTSPGALPGGTVDPGPKGHAPARSDDGADGRAVSPKTRKARGDSEPSSSPPLRDDPQAPGPVGPDDWTDADARQAWLQRWIAIPEHTRKLASSKPWADYQRLHAGDHEVKLKTSDERNEIWADGVSLDPDRVVAVEAKYVTNSGRSLYEGTVPKALQDRLLEDFDREMRRYGAVVRDHGNPVTRLRLVVSTERAGQFLGERARRIIGSDADIEVQVRPEGDHSP